MIAKIYTTSKCKWCKIMKEYLKEKSIEYEEYDVETDKQKDAEMFEKSEQRSVPVIDIDGTIIIGFDQEAIDACINK